MKFASGTKLFYIVIHQANVSKLQVVRLGRYLVHEIQYEIVQGMHLEKKINTDNICMMMGSLPVTISNRNAETLILIPLSICSTCCCCCQKTSDYLDMIRKEAGNVQTILLFCVQNHDVPTAGILHVTSTRAARDMKQN